MAYVAIIICEEHNAKEGASRPLLGLTIGDRLMRSLAKGGITHVVFAGNGSKPLQATDDLQIVEWPAIQDSADNVIVVSSDLVFDPALLDARAVSDHLPLSRISPAEVPTLIASPEQFIPDASKRESNNGIGFAIRVTDEDSAKVATRCLMLSLQKDADGIISRTLNRKISTFISKRLAPFPIRPNHVTAIVFLIGIAAGPFAFLGTHLGFALGGFCYWFSAVLDGCDGEISRLKYQGSALGAWLDTVVDDLVCLSYISGMYYGLHRNANHPHWSYLGMAAVVFFVLSLLPRYYVMARRGSGDYQKLAKAIRPDEVTGVKRIILHARDIVFRTDFLPFAGMVTAVIGYPQVFAAPFAIGAVITAFDSVNTLFKTRKETAISS